MPHALLVEDDAESLAAMLELVGREGFETSTARSLDEARQAVAETFPDVVLLDLKLPDGQGLDLLPSLEDGGSPEIVLITGHASVDTAVEALRSGITDYLTKPVDVKRLRAVLANVRRRRELREEIHELRDELRQLGRFGRLVGASKPMQVVYDRIARVAPTDATVLIVGESGTGKEVVARTIHDLSKRRNGELWPLNCGAVSSTLMESELFGHEKGAFTGADRRHRGYFERAAGGSLFLDEITEMPLESQVKLLRALETGRLTRVGGEEQIHVDVRVIAATNRKVEEAVAQGELREDLYYRLKVFQIYLPPLRDRAEDIELLAQHFLEEVNAEEEENKRFSGESIAVLQRHPWRGNVRELQNVVRSAFILADEVITPECLPAEVLGDKEPGPMRGTALQVKVGTPIADVERRLILATLEECEGNKTRAAEKLGVSVKTLYNRLKAYEREAAASSR